MSTLEAFKAEVEQFLADNNISATRFGIAALRDPRFVHELRQGRAPSMVTAERVREFMQSPMLSLPRPATAVTQPEAAP